MSAGAKEFSCYRENLHGDRTQWGSESPGRCRLRAASIRCVFACGRASRKSAAAREAADEATYGFRLRVLPRRTTPSALQRSAEADGSARGDQLAALYRYGGGALAAVHSLTMYFRPLTNAFHSRPDFCTFQSGGACLRRSLPRGSPAGRGRGLRNLCKTLLNDKKGDPMVMSVNTNVLSPTAQRNMVGTQNLLSTSIERLSTACINSARDDAGRVSPSLECLPQAFGVRRSAKCQ